MERYIVVSADCHAGADLADYRPYLEDRYRDEFDRWLAGYENPFRDLTAPDADRRVVIQSAAKHAAKRPERR